jgi:hypothetical protein
VLRCSVPLTARKSSRPTARARGGRLTWHGCERCGVRRPTHDAHMGLLGLVGRIF